MALEQITVTLDPEHEMLVRVAKCLKPEFRTVDGALLTGEFVSGADGTYILQVHRDDTDNPIKRHVGYLSQLIDVQREQLTPAQHNAILVAWVDR